MELFINFSLLFLFVIWLQYEIRKNDRLSKKSSEHFWEQERSANLSRKKDISALDYITIPLERLPMTDHEDATINSYRDTIYALSDKKILNLTGLTNTELKLKYGASNIHLLSEYDNNYTILVSILQKWGERLYNHRNIPEAITVLEFAVMCLTDSRKTYRLLAKIYKEQDTPELIEPMLDIIPFTRLDEQESLLEELRRIRDS